MEKTLEQNINFIAELRRAHDAIKGARDYCWMDYASCNCGIVARSLMKLNGDNFRALFLTEHEKGFIRGGSYGININLGLKCSSTGIPMSTVFKTLLNAGYTPQDINRLENGGIGKGNILAEIINWRNELITSCRAQLEKLSHELNVEADLITLLNAEMSALIPIVNYKKEGVEA